MNKMKKYPCKYPWVLSKYLYPHLVTFGKYPYLGTFPCECRQLTSSNTSNQRQQSQLQWVVPCTNQQSNTIRFRLHETVISHVDQGLLHLLRGWPLLQVIEMLDGIVLDEADLHQHRLIVMLQKYKKQIWLCSSDCIWNPWNWSYHLIRNMADIQEYQWLTPLADWGAWWIYVW